MEVSNTEFKIVKILDPNTPFQLVNDMENLNYYFRGQADASWRLSSTMERACGLFNGRLRSGIEPNEKKILQEFREYAKNNPGRYPKCNLDDDLECLAVLQHHGTPTRLIDFTESFLTALFFAMENASNIAAVWCLNHDKMQIQLTDGCLSTNRTADFLGNRQYKDWLVPCVLPVSLPEKCPRHEAQKGLFLYTTDYRLTFEQEFAHHLGFSSDYFDLSLEEQLLNADSCDPNLFKDVAIIKLLIPCGPNQKTRKRIMKGLKERGITSETLFPDFDGFARSLYSLTLRDIY